MNKFKKMSIEQLLLQTCKCSGQYNNYYGNHINNDSVCTFLNIKLSETTIGDKKKDILNYIINNYNCIKKISEKNYNKLFLNDENFLKTNKKKILEFYDLLKKKCGGTGYYDNIFNSANHLKNLYTVLKYWSNNNIFCDKQLIEKYLTIFEYEKKNYSHYSNNSLTEPEYNDFLKFVLNHVTNENIISFISARWALYYKILVEKINKKNIKLDQKMLYEALKYFDYSKVFIDYLLKNGLAVDSQCLEIVCEYGDIEAIRFVLDYRIIPEEIHFHKLFKSKIFQGKMFYGYYRNNFNQNDDGYSYAGSGYTKDKFELLSTHGYKLTEYDLIESIKTKCEIPNIEKYNLNLDKDILDFCDENEFFPSYKFTCISKEMMELRDLCAKGGIPPVRSFIKKNDLVPDIVCMKNACKLKANYAVVNLLLEKGGKLNDECLKYACENITSG